MAAKTKQQQFTLAEAKAIGDKLGIQWDAFDVKQFRLGLNAERKDGAYNPITNFASDDPLQIGKVVRTHLNATPDYYTHWAQMEKDAKQDHPKAKPDKK